VQNAIAISGAPILIKRLIFILDLLGLHSL
jgi:hypothetical protein